MAAAGSGGRTKPTGCFRSPQSRVSRRSLLAGLASTSVGMPVAALAPVSLRTAPIEVTGDWGRSLPGSAQSVVTRMRDVSLDGLALLSDRQPARIRVDAHISGPPHIWLHFDGTPIAWIVVDVGERDWCKLAYQFGHELGHVLANSWGPDARPAPPCQWLEEALVEAFALRGLGLLAESWARTPVFTGDSAFAGAIRSYRADLLARYRAGATTPGIEAGMPAWYSTQENALESDGGIAGPAQEAVPALLAELEDDPGAVEALGALNRWPGRTSVPMADYLRLWKRSCAELGLSQRLAMRVRRLLG